MRRQYFYWIYLVTAIVLTIYGGYSVFYNLANNKKVPTLGLVFFIVGTTLIVIYLILYVITFFEKKKAIKDKEPELEKEEPAPVVEEPKAEPEIEEKEETITPVTYNPRPKVIRNEGEVRPSRSFDGGSGYVNKVGYGPVLRVTNEEILDMRSNTYYRIEGNMVKQSGSGPVFEISGNRIRLAFGGYLYEISGGNINKVYGGFYASISGNYIQTHDLKEKYEMTGQLNKVQILVVAALLFGEY